MKRLAILAAVFGGIVSISGANAATVVGGYVGGELSSTNWANSGASNDGGGSVAGKGYTATNSNQFSTSTGVTSGNFTGGTSTSTSNTYGGGSTFTNTNTGKGGFDYSGTGNSAAATTGTIVGAVGGFTTSGF
jgi:hypothetical protein